MAVIQDQLPESAEQYNEDILAVLKPPTPLYVIAVLGLAGIVSVPPASQPGMTKSGPGWGGQVTRYRHRPVRIPLCS